MKKIEVRYKFDFKVILKVLGCKCSNFFLIFQATSKFIIVFVS